MAKLRPWVAFLSTFFLSADLCAQLRQIDPAKLPRDQPDRLLKRPVYRVHGTQLETIGTFAGGTREGGGILNQRALRLISSTVSGNTVVQIQGVLTSPPPQKGSA